MYVNRIWITAQSTFSQLFKIFACVHTPPPPPPPREVTSVIYHPLSCMEVTWFLPEGGENDLIDS